MFKKNIIFVKNIRFFISRFYTLYTVFLILIFVFPLYSKAADKKHKTEIRLLEKVHGTGFVTRWNDKPFLVFAQKSAAWSNSSETITIQELDEGSRRRTFSLGLQHVIRLLPTEKGFYAIGTNDSLRVAYYDFGTGGIHSCNLSRYGFFAEEISASLVENSCLMSNSKDKSMLVDTLCSVVMLRNDILFVHKSFSKAKTLSITKSGNAVHLEYDSLSLRLPSFEKYTVGKRSNDNIMLYMCNTKSSIIQTIEFSGKGKLIASGQIKTKRINSGFLNRNCQQIEWMTNDEDTELATLNVSDNSINYTSIETEVPDEEMSLFGLEDNKRVLWNAGYLSIVGSSYEGGWKTRELLNPTISQAGKFIAISDERGLYLLETRNNSTWWIYQGIDKYGVLVFTLFGFLIIGVILFAYIQNKKILSVLLDKNGEVGIVFINRQGGIIESNRKAQQYLDIKSPELSLVELLKNIAPEFSVKMESIMLTRTSGTGVFPLQYGGDTKDYSIEWIPILSSFGRLQLIIVRITDLTNALEKRRMLDWAHLSHDMQTNLSVIRLSAESLHSDDYEINRQKGKILHQVNILLRRVRDIMTIARERRTEFQKISSEEICRRVIEELDTGSLYTISVKSNISSVIFDAEPEKLIRGIMNAAQNSIKAMAGTEGLLTISTYYDSNNVYFSVQDTGVGMDEETRKNMFVPFFTTSRLGGGSGIGTMVIQKIVSDHKGTIKVDSELGVGTTITISVPRKQKQGVQ